MRPVTGPMPRTHSSEHHIFVFCWAQKHGSRGSSGTRPVRRNRTRRLFGLPATRGAGGPRHICSPLVPSVPRGHWFRVRALVATLPPQRAQTRGIRSAHSPSKITAVRRRLSIRSNNHAMPHLHLCFRGAYSTVWRSWGPGAEQASTIAI